MKNLWIWSTLIGIALCSMISSCKEDDDDSSSKPLTNLSYTMKYSEKVAFEGETDLKIENPFIASLKDGYINGNHIGTTTGSYKGKQTISIEVKPMYSYVDYPITDWGCSQATIKSKQPSVWKLQSNSNTTSLTYLQYSGSAVKYITIYTFNNGKLKTSGLLSPVNELTSLSNWLSQKYFMVSTSSSTIAVTGSDAYDPADSNTIVGISSETLSSTSYSLYSKYMYMTVFGPYTATKASNSIVDSPEYDSIIESLKSLGIQISESQIVNGQ